MNVLNVALVVTTQTLQMKLKQNVMIERLTNGNKLIVLRRGVNIMKFDLTMKELLKIIQKELNGLKGKNVVKEGGIAKLIEDIINGIQIEGTFLSRYNVYIDYCLLKMYCSGMDKDIEFAVIRQTYKEDKRKSNGHSDVLENVTVELTKEIPLDMEVLNVSQFLDYEEAKVNFERLKRQQRELLEEYKSNYEAMEKLRSVMKSEAYNKETIKESENAEGVLEEFSSFKI